MNTRILGMFCLFFSAQAMDQSQWSSFSTKHNAHEVVTCIPKSWESHSMLLQFMQQVSPNATIPLPISSEDLSIVLSLLKTSNNATRRQDIPKDIEQKALEKLISKKQRKACSRLLEHKKLSQQQLSKLVYSSGFLNLYPALDTVYKQYSDSLIDSNFSNIEAIKQDLNLDAFGKRLIARKTITKDFLASLRKPRLYHDMSFTEIQDIKLVCSPCGNYVALGLPHSITIYNLKNSTIHWVHICPNDQKISALTWHPTEPIIAYGKGLDVMLIDIAQKELTLAIEEEQDEAHQHDEICVISFNSDGTRIAVGFYSPHDVLKGAVYDNNYNLLAEILLDNPLIAIKGFGWGIDSTQLFIGTNHGLYVSTLPHEIVQEPLLMTQLGQELGAVDYLSTVFKSDYALCETATTIDLFSLPLNTTVLSMPGMLGCISIDGNYLGIASVQNNSKDLLLKLYNGVISETPEHTLIIPDGAIDSKTFTISPETEAGRYIVIQRLDEKQHITTYRMPHENTIALMMQNLTLEQAQFLHELKLNMQSDELLVFNQELEHIFSTFDTEVQGMLLPLTTYSKE